MKIIITYDNYYGIKSKTIETMYNFLWAKLLIKIEVVSSDASRKSVANAAIKFRHMLLE